MSEKERFQKALTDVINEAVRFQNSQDFGSEKAKKARSFVYAALDLFKALDTIKEEADENNRKNTI